MNSGYGSRTGLEGKGGRKDMGDDALKNSRTDAESAAEQQMTELDVEMEMALLTLSAQDMGEPTEDLDLTALTPNEKRVLLDLLRQRLGNVPTSGTPHPADTRINSGQGKSA